MKNTLNITEGKWEIDKRAKRRVHCNDTTIANCSAGQGGELEEKEHANAKLIADAGTTYNECQILPSELKKQRNELLEVLKKIKLHLGDIEGTRELSFTEILVLGHVREAIKNCEL